MKETYIQIFGLAVFAVFGVFIVFLYAAEPRSIEDISTKARTAVENAVTKGQVVTGTYEVNAALFNEGIVAFRADNFVLARDLFDRADPEKRDPATQFYIAYSYYRQGFGRVSNDDALFRSGIDTLDRVVLLDKNYKATDPDLKLKTPAELRNELDEGLKVTAGDFNPLKVFNERK